MKKLIVVSLAAIILAGCNPKPKPPVIVPPTPPPVNYHPELRLTTARNLFVYADGHAPFEFRKVISCCRDTVGTGWPGLSESFVQYAYQQGRATMLHWRVGPFRSANEPEWQATGGGAYLEAPDGRADLTQWNEPYWQALQARLQQAGDLGIVVEISLNDGWGVKVKKWASNSSAAAWHPWHPLGNIQGQDHLSTAWRAATLDPVQDAFIRQTVRKTCVFGNVTYEDGTEAEQVVSTPAERAVSIGYSLSILKAVREVEAEEGCAQHLYGSNFKADPVFPHLAANRIQYLNAHDGAPTDAAAFWGSDPWRPYVSDETNPEPPYTAIVNHSFYSYALAHGTYWTAWRGDTPANEWQATLSLIAGGPRADYADGCPYDVPTVDRISLRQYTRMGDGWMYDATPMANNRPIRAEGDPTRFFCEAVACGLCAGGGAVACGHPAYTLVNPTAALPLTQRPNPFQFTVRGHGTATVRCTAPATGERDLCAGFQVNQ